MTKVGQALEGSREDNARACGETSAGDVRGWSRAGGDSWGDNGPPTKREGGVLGNWSSRYFMEGVLSSGELLLKKECRGALCTLWVQGRALDGEGYFGGQSGTESGQAFTQAPLTGLPGCP